MANKDYEKRGLKTRTPFSSTMDNDLVEKFYELSKETKIPKTKLIDSAVELLLKQHNKL